MYHPYLFARRAELLALRDLSAAFPLSLTVSPILEPIKSDSGDLCRCLRILGESGVRVLVIVNPTEGDFSSAAVREPWRQSLDGVLGEFTSLLPTYVCRPTTTEQEVEAFFSAYPERALALIYWSPNLTNPFIEYLATRPQVLFHVNLHEQMSEEQRALLPTTKTVDVIDHFDRQARNADYDGIEFFSDDHQTFQTDSVGFGDFSVIGARYIPGGGQAYAVVIHAIYQHTSGSLWVEHFVSDDTDVEIGTVEGKYLQAATKLIEAVDLRPTEFGNDPALDGYRNDVDTQYFPGLAMNKRRQIYHHIALVHNMLSA